ncbi:unnamed protein product [Symbiodinium microadriaticum]|nr:unnamed protein product [Symbiodinium microadriaticum]CAE7938500.1 unnamed protein product [Symbiodinium sp. KB8]
MPQAVMTYDPVLDEESRTLSLEQEELLRERHEEGSRNKVVYRALAALAAVAAIAAVFQLGSGLGSALRGTETKMHSPIQLEESCGRSADKVKLQDVIQEKGFPLCVSVNDAKMDGESLNILKHGWGYTCPVSTVGLFNKCYEVKCEKKSAKEMGQHVMDGLSHHAGNLMGALSGALTGDDQKDKKMFKEEDKPDMDLGATAKSAWASMLSDDKEKDVCVGGRKVHVWKVTE